MSGNLRHNLERLRRATISSVCAETSQTRLRPGLTKASRRSSGEMIISIMRKRVSSVRAVIVPVAGFHKSKTPVSRVLVGSNIHGHALRLVSGATMHLLSVALCFTRAPVYDAAGCALTVTRGAPRAEDRT
jgi:hypothetical protein